MNCNSRIHSGYFYQLIWLRFYYNNCRYNQNESYYCNSCVIDYQPDNENVRRETKLSVPDRNTETLAATTPGIPDISIHHTPEPKGAFKALQQKGLKIKDYKEE